ncbi:MAG: bifunctional hydroxymethylpyrimidine kinase/phosphomethylpyrimidine kinase, partial [Armatimonadota bacterium]
KGGHVGEGAVVDVLFDAETGVVHRYEAPRIDTQNTHGTGCTFSSAIAAFLARGWRLERAVAWGKRFVTEAIRRGLPLGSGHGPTDHIGAGRMFR